MVSKTIPGFRDEDEFRQILRENITPTEPISNPALLRGREAKLREIDRAFNSRGAHIFIHGERGVGKTSLALSAATLKHPSSSEPLYIGCDHTSTFQSLANDLITQLLQHSYGQVKERPKHSFTLGVPGLASYNLQTAPGGQCDLIGVTTINQAVDMIEAALRARGELEPVFIIDEFDQLQGAEEKRLFASFVKRLYDRRSGLRFIFCGIGTSLDAITGGHLSASRPILPVELEPVPHDARWRILEGAAEKLDFKIDRNFVIRAGQISDGFPYYVHLIGMALFWRVFDHAESSRSASTLDFAAAVNEAVQQAESPLRAAYESAVRKTTGWKDYEEVLWAVADGQHLVRQFQDIFSQSYLKIMEAQGKTPISIEVFRRRLYQLCDATHGSIVIRERNSWYRFSENVVRGYVRLQAQRSGVELGKDHF